MASRWYYRIALKPEDGRLAATPDSRGSPNSATSETPLSEMGPLTFDELAQRIADGSLTEDDLVRREASGEWQPVHKVVGLQHRARQLETRAAARNVAMPDAAASFTSGPVAMVAVTTIEDFTSPLPSSDSDSEARRPIRLALLSVPATLLVVWLAWTGWSAHVESRRFPLPVHLRDQAAAGWHFLGWGPLSGLEYVLLWCDAVGVAAFVVYLIARQLRRSGV
ncbi:MAG: DUF4339 domain-containing protein [Planctomycetaceae bacterium]|nr:DUF4339 domain-containing protein [Planctomycetaceae bacterium]